MLESSHTYFTILEYRSSHNFSNFKSVFLAEAGLEEAIAELTMISRLDSYGGKSWEDLMRNIKYKWKVRATPDCQSLWKGWKY